MKQPVLNILDYYKAKAFSLSSGLVPLEVNPNTVAENLMYVNNINEVQDQKLREYNAWYEGDSDRLLALYTGNMMYEYQTEPLHDRNKRDYFWSVSSTEDGIKRTHSGQPRNVVDTLVSIVGLPKINADSDNDPLLQKILKSNDFEVMFQQSQMPRTLVEGWGAYKIDWDSSFSEYPILLYYRADEVNFYYKNNKLVGILYKNYYKDEKDRNYILFELRRQSREKNEDGKWCDNLIVEKELFELGDNNTIKKMKLTDLKQLKDVEPVIKISNYSGFFGRPCKFYEPDDLSTGDGRSIFTGKLDLFDDLDQDLSQMANTVRRSTTHVYINNQYLERDTKTGMPIMPSSFDCNYVQLSGSLSADGSASGSEPVTTVQPRLDFEQYSANAISILVQAISGIMSPATLGIDIAKKDNAEAQREKEKVTIFTRNGLIRREESILKDVCNELLCAKEMMDKHGISKHNYDISVVFDEFADDSFEAKTETLLTLYNAKVLPDELFVELLYSGRSKKDRDRIIEYIKESKQAKNGGGMNPYDMAVMAGSTAPQPNEKVNVADVQEDMNVPEVVGTADNMRK